LPLRRDVLYEDDDSADFAGVCPPGLDLPAKPVDVAIGAFKDVSLARDDLALQSLPVRVLPALRKIRENLVMGATQNRVSQPVVAEPAPACGHVAHFAVEHGDRDRRLLNEGA
jgi:hypothetical protein